MSLGLLSRWPDQVSTTVSTSAPSRLIRETLRPFCSQKMICPSCGERLPIGRSGLFANDCHRSRSGSSR